MKILHLYPRTDDMIARHVSILAEGMRHSAEVQTATDQTSFQTACQQMQPDIVHCHGCWHYFVAHYGAIARNHGARIVVSPHGGLAPWVLQERPLQEKIQKWLLWQKRSIEQAYVLIAFGKMEQQNLSRLGWNPRISVVSNAVTTNSITPEKMCSQTFAIYQKVIDSNVLETIDESSRQLIATLIKAGITGDRRWVEPYIMPDRPDWRRILIYAEHQNIRNYVDYGIHTLEIDAPAINTSLIASFFPEAYQTPRPLKESIGNYEGDETDYLMRMIRHIQHKPLLLNLIELHRELRRDTVDDGRLKTALTNEGLYDYASRLMQILSEQTLLEEGYMPLPPTNDRGTQKIRNLITNHLKI